MASFVVEEDLKWCLPRDCETVTLLFPSPLVADPPQVPQQEVQLPRSAHHLRHHRLLQRGLVHPAEDHPQRAGDHARRAAEGDHPH